MTRATKRNKSDLLTEVELEMMNVLWELQSATAKEVQQALRPDRDLAYTSVSTMLRILESKGALRASKEGRGHRYHPEISREQYGKRSMHHLVENVFSKQPVTLAKHLISDKALSRKELEQLRTLLDERLN